MDALPQRKPTRLQEYDYSAAGAYFLTVCTKEKKHLLGEIVEGHKLGIDGRSYDKHKLGVDAVGGGVYDAPSMVLSEFGQVLDKYIRLMDARSSNIAVDKYVIMPNHFHLILRVTGSENGASETAAPYNRRPSNNAVPQFVSLLKRYCNREYGGNIWQRSFHDHIIRGEEDYRKIWEYIDQNVLRWEMDCFYT